MYSSERISREGRNQSGSALVSGSIVLLRQSLMFYASSQWNQMRTSLLYHMRRCKLDKMAATYAYKWVPYSHIDGYTRIQTCLKDSTKRQLSMLLLAKLQFTWSYIMISPPPPAPEWSKASNSSCNKK